MAHTYRNKTQVNDQTGTSIVHLHNPGAAATVAILSIVVAGTTARSGSPATPIIDGVLATQASTTQSNGEDQVEVWYVCKPFSGAEFSTTTPNAGGLSCSIEVVTADAGTGYQSYYTHAASATALLSTDDGLTVNVTSSATGDFLYSRVVCGEAAVGSIAESSTNPTKILTWENDHGAFTSSGHYAASDGSGTESFIWTWTNDVGAATAVAFKSLVLPLISPTKETTTPSDASRVRLAQLITSRSDRSTISDILYAKLAQLIAKGADISTISDNPEVFVEGGTLLDITLPIMADTATISDIPGLVLAQLVIKSSSILTLSDICTMRLAQLIITPLDRLTISDMASLRMAQLIVLPTDRILMADLPRTVLNELIVRMVYF